jgi:erythromycin esterase
VKHSRFAWQLRLFLALWISTLGGCGGGGGGGGSPQEPAQSPAPAPAPAPQLPTGLFTDAQLRTQEDRSPASVDEASADWFAANAQIIRSLTVDDDFSDLAFLDAPLQDKRIVALGESSHGVREYSQAKVRLIKYLHQNLGYNVLAFESGLFDCEEAQRRLATMSARDAMNACLFGIWQTEAVLELFEYVAGTQNSDSPLRITGFDTQISGTGFASRARWTSDLVRKVAPSYANDVFMLEERYYNLAIAVLQAEFGGDPAVTRLNSERGAIAADYLALADFLDVNVDNIAASDGITREDVLVAAQYARSSPRYLEQLSLRFTSDRGSRTRDRGMADNLIALAERVFPDEKLIVWAHNAHIRHEGADFLLNANMGFFVHEKLASELYSIGFYMYRGQHAFNDRTVSAVQPPLDRSLEANFYRRRLAWLFVDLDGAAIDDPGTAWLDRSTSVWAWGSRETNLVLRQEYSGLIVIDTVRSPNYL